MVGISCSRRLCISSGRFTFCDPFADALPMNGSHVAFPLTVVHPEVHSIGVNFRFTSCVLPPSSKNKVCIIRRLSDQNAEVGPNWSHFKFKGRGQRLAGWGFAGRDRRSRLTWTQIASTSMPYALTPRYQRASWPFITHIICIINIPSCSDVDIIVITIIILSLIHI